MTTIVYNHKDKQIAVDGRTTRDNIIVSDTSIKWRKEQGVLFFLCGIVPDYPLLIAAYFGKCPVLIPECNAFVVDKGKVYRIGVTMEGVFWSHELQNSDAFGSGMAFALAALDFNLNATEAVEYVKTRDAATGGRVHTYDIESDRFLYDSPL